MASLDSRSELFLLFLISKIKGNFLSGFESISLRYFDLQVIPIFTTKFESVGLLVQKNTFKIISKDFQKDFQDGGYWAILDYFSK